MELLKILGGCFVACGTYITLASLTGLPNSWEYGLGVLVVGTIMILVGTRKK
jgi:hypothetical protein